MIDHFAPLGASGTHVAQFYESDGFLCDAVTGFLAGGLDSDQPVLVIATPQHRELIATNLATRGYDVEDARRRGRLTVLDVRETLATFMRGDEPDPDSFRHFVGGAIERSVNGRADTVLRAYGEMVDVVLQDGNPDAALRIEHLWNDLAATYRFALVCGYRMGNFHKEAHSARFHDICHTHQHVVPTETYLGAPDEAARLLEISRLQQRARALEDEIARREALEQSMREALDERERAQAERERLLAGERAARAEAEKASRLKDEFLAILSHELRTPLNAILGWTQIATSHNNDQETIRRTLTVIQRNATLQLHVVDELLDVSRMVSGKMRVHLDRVDLAEVVTAAIETVRPAAAGKQIALNVHMAPDLPAIRADADRLQQVIWNLLSNAIKFTPETGIVTVSVERAGDQIEIVVSDTGIGIAPEFLPHVFDRFRQADSGTARHHGGLGLGLALVRYLVEAHGGTVAAQSEGTGRGATVTVRLPARAPLSATTRGSDEPRDVALRNARLLVVDDDNDARELFTYMLTRSGAVVNTAPSVDAALQLLESRQYDVLLADIGMPGRDGYALIKEVRGHPNAAIRCLPTVAITSYAGDQYRMRTAAAGFDGYVTKPVESDHLARVVADLLKQPRSIEQATQRGEATPHMLDV